MKLPTNFQSVVKIHSPPDSPVPPSAPSSSPGTQNPSRRPGRALSAASPSQYWADIPRPTHTLQTQLPPSIAASGFRDYIHRQVPVLISSPGGAHATTFAALALDSGSCATGSPKCQFAHSSPCRPPARVPDSPLPRSQWAKHGSTEAALPSRASLPLPRFLYQRFGAFSLALPEGHLPRPQLAAKISLSPAKCLLLPPWETTTPEKSEVPAKAPTC